MCGIFSCIHDQDYCRERCLTKAIFERLKRRGPDCMRETSVPIPGSQLQLDLVGTVLGMRGPRSVPQPVTNQEGDCLLWNGNVFGGDIQIAAGENDTVRVLEGLTAQQSSGPEGVLQTLSGIHGPWACVFWQASSRSVWFGRDVFGRRSLLWHLPTNETDILALCSVGHHDLIGMPLGYWQEVPACGVFQLKCRGPTLAHAELCCHLWIEQDCPFQTEGSARINSLHTVIPTSVSCDNHLLVPFPRLNKQLPRLELPPSTPPPPPPPPPSRSPPLPPTTTKDDVTVCDSDVITEPGLVSGSQEAYRPGPLLCRSTEPAQLEAAMAGPGAAELEANWSSLAHQLVEVLQRAVGVRVENAPSIVGCRGGETTAGLSASAQRERESPQKSEKGADSDDVILGGAGVDSDDVILGGARVAVLFSGGVDSTVLAALTDRCLDPSEEVDLINVAFEQKSSAGSNAVNFNVPDRLSSLRCVKELNPRRKWNLVQVNVTLEEVNRMRRDRISQLVYPLGTVLDDSIGCALWFAGRGEGGVELSGSPELVSYRSRARTLLVGIGADEQLAGYSRHRTKFRSTGWKGLVDEVEMEIKRLAERNLGRDDRCIADQQREAQLPFLDENVVTFLQQLPMWQKADLSLPRGKGEKKLLREVATILGCHSAASLPKRAIQFGSRMAKLAGSSNSREHGSDLCSRLLPLQ